MSPSRNSGKWPPASSPVLIVRLADNRTANCPPTQVDPSDFPPNFRSNNPWLCGTPIPQDTRLTNLSSCCTGPVQVSNSCFQYCPVQSQIVFRGCYSTLFPSNLTDRNGAIGSGGNEIINICNPDDSYRSGAGGRYAELMGAGLEA